MTIDPDRLATAVVDIIATAIDRRVKALEQELVSLREILERQTADLAELHEALAAARAREDGAPTEAVH
jgi:predicted transcriptional regulator